MEGGGGKYHQNFTEFCGFFLPCILMRNKIMIICKNSSMLFRKVCNFQLRIIHYSRRVIKLSHGTVIKILTFSKRVKKRALKIFKIPRTQLNCKTKYTKCSKTDIIFYLFMRVQVMRRSTLGIKVFCLPRMAPR